MLAVYTLFSGVPIMEILGNSVVARGEEKVARECEGTGAEYHPGDSPQRESPVIPGSIFCIGLLRWREIAPSLQEDVVIPRRRRGWRRWRR
jgi:hypothetical protein